MQFFNSQRINSRKELKYINLKKNQRQLAFVSVQVNEIPWIENQECGSTNSSFLPLPTPFMRPPFALLFYIIYLKKYTEFHNKIKT